MSKLDFVTRANQEYVEEQYRRYQEDPASLDERWAAFFAGFELASPSGNGAVPGLSAVPASAASSTADLVHSYRELGHLAAHLNPLSNPPDGHPLLDPREFGFEEHDLDRIVDPGGFRGVSGPVPLRDLVGALRATYCGTLAVEYLHIQDQRQRQWLQERMEPGHNRPLLAPEERVRLHDELMSAEQFELFLGLRYPTAKRFSLEGGESLVPMLTTIIEQGGDLGAEEMVFGMPHRGRLTVLANVLRKPFEMILAEFEGSLLAREATGDGDVKYHLGYSHDHKTRSGRSVHLSLGANPSHLEAINPVIEGMVRAKQNHLGDFERSRVVPLLMHGDAAFTGQGVVFETLWLSELAGYWVGGTIHVIVNNQVGFTASPEEYRFTPYPSDVAKIIQAPIFHVNGDDPEAAIQAAQLAIGFRQTFKKDAVIHLVCYRKHGHNELDDPTFTQPVMYRAIAEHPSPYTQYRARLIADGDLTEKDANARMEDFREILDAAHMYARDFMPRQQIFVFGGLWKGFGWAGEDRSARTAVGSDVLTTIADAFTQWPAGFTPHPRLAKLLEQRREMVTTAGEVDWACAEALAFGSLALEGTTVRLSGQDCGRGTFSHRHAVLHDHETGATWIPLDRIREGQGRVVILNSMLSENAVLGFEVGYAMADPRKLVVWEAQFGDFANGAQVVIDQFIASSESKWQRMCGIVLLLPHGYEGQGPEHSSARLERYLQLCADDNLQVVNPTTPAQIFHALRRQIHRTFRKPLIVMSPKSLLRHKLALSPLADLTGGGFRLVIDDIARGDAPEAGVQIDPARVTRLLLATGKIYYALLAARRERQNDTTAIVRVEQLYPFPRAELETVLATYAGASQVYWVQEEPRNMGAWQFIEDHLRRLLPAGRKLSYVGRDEAASPASGSYKLHQREEAELLTAAFAR